MQERTAFIWIIGVVVCPKEQPQAVTTRHKLLQYNWLMKTGSGNAVKIKSSGGQSDNPYKTYWDNSNVSAFGPTHFFKIHFMNLLSLTHLLQIYVNVLIVLTVISK